MTRRHKTSRVARRRIIHNDIPTHDELLSKTTITVQQQLRFGIAAQHHAGAAAVCEAQRGLVDGDGCQRHGLVGHVQSGDVHAKLGVDVEFKHAARVYLAPTQSL